MNISLIFIILLFLVALVNLPKLLSSVDKQDEGLINTKTPVPTIKDEIITPLLATDVTPSTDSSEKDLTRDYFYPSSSVLNGESPSGKVIELTSEDDPNEITRWYKEKMGSLGLSTTSFVQTNTNGNILNSLIGADGVNEIKVDIIKRNDQPVTNIKVDINS